MTAFGREYLRPSSKVRRPVKPKTSCSLSTPVCLIKESESLCVNSEYVRRGAELL